MRSGGASLFGARTTVLTDLAEPGPPKPRGRSRMDARATLDAIIFQLRMDGGANIGLALEVSGAPGAL